MIKAKHHIVIYPMFQKLTRLLLKRNFSTISIQGKFPDNGKSVLVVANHISWWDGFWIMLLNLNVIKRRFHFMMLEEQLKKHWYFQYTGGFSIKKKSRSIIESINYSNQLLEENDNMVLMFPQGEINSMHKHNIKFNEGIKRIVQQSTDDSQILFVANILDYFSDSKPNLTINTETHLVKDFYNNDIEKAYNTFYTEVLSAQEIKTS